LVKVIRVDWTDTAKAALRTVFNYHVEYSESSAENIVNEIIDTGDSIVFAKQYQIDEINPNYRRMIVRDYKVLYNEQNNIIQILDVVNTKQSPEELKNK
jgi:plasmid stabilization system protein ParE